MKIILNEKHPVPAETESAPRCIQQPFCGGHGTSGLLTRAEALAMGAAIVRPSAMHAAPRINIPGSGAASLPTAPAAAPLASDALAPFRIVKTAPLNLAQFEQLSHEERNAYIRAGNGIANNEN